MRRIKILYYWLFKSKNNVTFLELIKFLCKPVVRQIANSYIKEIRLLENEYEIVFENHRRHLFWPKAFPIDGVYQVTAETFDQQDWHYYQKKFTEVREGDVILDVGTAEGLFILAVIDRCNKVILIEPNDYFINVLNKSFASDLDKVVMYNVAIGDRVGEIYFNSSSLIGRVDTKLENGVKKKLETLDHLLLDEPNITFLKADVEGFELEMLIGAEKIIKRHKPRIAITTYHPENNSEEIIALVRKYVPEYKYYVKGVYHEMGRAVMVHFWT